MSAPDADAIRRACSRFLTHHGHVTPKDMFVALADSTPEDLEADTYGNGALVEEFEAEIAELLGKESAVFLPSGTLSQQAALRIWADRNGPRNIAMHPTNHLDRHEHFGYQRLHGLTGVPAGQPETLMTLEDLQGIHEPLAALLIELPQREIGGQLADWDDLVEQTGWARERGIAVHMDGARLWECKPFYGREYSEICELFDSVYVSFYKIIGGIAGAALAGPADFIDEARVWQHRHGGRLIRMFPMILSAKLGMEQRLGRMDTYHQKAVEIAAALREIPELEVMPDPPQTNMMHIFIRADGERLREAALAVSERTGVWIGDRFPQSQIPAYRRTEFTVGDAALEIEAQEIRELYQEVLQVASQ